jgi:hypothetical protein
MRRPSAETGPSEELPYVIELWRDGNGSSVVERILARAASARLAREILKAAENEYPGRRITLRNGDSLVGDAQ